jgi:phosphonate transport system substrate-binding protein
MRYTLFLIIFLLSSCREAWVDPEKHVWINFNDTSAVVVSESTLTESPDVLRVAIASMSTPDETIYKYNDLLNYLEQRLDRKVILIQRKTYKEVNQLLKHNEIDLAFICSGAYVAGIQDSSFKLLLIPERDKDYHYHAYMIVREDSPYHDFSELRGRKFVFSDSLSNTGMYYPLKRLHDLNSTAQTYFSETYLSHAHNNSIELVSRGIVDGASVNSLIFDFIRKTDPEKVSNVRILEESMPFGIPPLVVSNNINLMLKHDLVNILTNMVKNKEGRDILRSLMINRFVEGTDTLYDGIREMRSEYTNLVMNKKDERQKILSTR